MTTIAAFKRVAAMVRAPIWIFLAFGFVVVAIWLSIPWSWSTIDDAGFAVGWASADRDGKTLGYGVSQVVAGFQSDLGWGLFRPSYWLYPSLVYWMPIEAVHLIRLLMFAAAVAGPLFLLQRRGLDRGTLVMAGLVIVSAGSLLTNGLFFLSLQELSGAAFVGMGLAARSHWWRICLWVIAAWFKSPFSWLLLAEAVVQWRRGKRLQASVSAGFGLGTLVLGALFARSGNYTAKYGLDPWRILTNAANLVEVWTVLILVMVLWWLVVTQTPLRFTDLSLVLFIGFAGYTAQMLPWAVSGYYMGPIIYLLGLFLASMLTNHAGMSLWHNILAYSAPIVIALYVLYLPLSQGFKMNAFLGDITACLTAEGSGDFTILGFVDYVTTEEGVVRMTQNAQLDDPLWNGTVTLMDPSASARTDTLVCSTGPINIYRL